MIQRRTIERDALIAARVAAFVFISGNMSVTEMAAIFLRALAGIIRFVQRHEPPYIVTIYQDGTLKQVAIAH